MTRAALSPQPIARTSNDRTQLAKRRTDLLLELDRLGPDDRREAAALATEITVLTWAIVANRIGVPIDLQPASVDDDATEALQAVRGYIRDDLPAGRCLVLSGPTGRGKSWAAVAALRAAVGLDHRVYFEYFPALCNALMAPDRRQGGLERSKDSALVVLDDFGAEYLKIGGFLDSLVEEIFWFREGNRLPTIITTNLTTEQLRARLSDRIVDRLRGAWGRIVELPGASLRRKENA